MNQAILTEAEIEDFAVEWYQKLDVHAPAEDYILLLAKEGLEMQFPEGTFRGFGGFKDWYENAISGFFDEVHTLKKVELTSLSNDRAKVQVIVNWRASRWNSPAPQSERIVLDAYQTWVVKRSPYTQKPVIQTYIANDMRYAEGSPRL